ncbi:MAG: BamA/TamA family outer membrane protein [Bryobacterales bacterium]|nr:BamA/TamA family outer membrane protein [Bryobacterales bacterium]
MSYRLLSLTLLLCVPAAAQPPVEDPAAVNVNARYTVENVELQPVSIEKLSRSLRTRVHGLIGNPFDQASFDDIARRIREELRTRVNMRVVKGTAPNHIKVVFEVTMTEETSFDLSVPRLLYHSRQNFTAAVEGSVRHGAHTAKAGALTDNDQLVERYSGVTAGYEFAATRRLRLRAEAASFRSQWAETTEAAAPEGTLYRTRLRLDPSAQISLFRPLTLQLGVSVDRLEYTTPTTTPQLSSAARFTLRFDRRWELGPDFTQRLEGAYNLRSGLSSLSSDYSFTRHQAESRYTLRHHKSELRASLEGGLLNGRAPLFERFTIGNSRTLRGWNRLQLDPLGAERYGHASVEYRMRWLRMIYDTGSAWQRRGPIVVRHSAAIGYISESSGLTALIAFPLRNGTIEPILLLGLNF